MKLSFKIRKIWHDFFYRSANKKVIKFARSCQNVTADIDLQHIPIGVAGHFRFWLHLSLCQACKNYYDVSRAFSKALRKNPQQLDINVESLNQILLNRHSRNEKK